MPDAVEGAGASPIKPGGSPGGGAGEPKIGAGQEGQKPFGLSESKESAPSPMELAGQGGGQKQIPPQQLADKLQQAQQSLEEAKGKLNNPSISQKLTEQHHEALRQVQGKLNGDLKTIAENSEGKAQLVPQEEGGGAVKRFLGWINGSQKTLSGALNYLSETKKPNVASYMKMQYAVQRATQRAELFSSVVSSSVSGLKTLMSTQLG